MDCFRYRLGRERQLFVDDLLVAETDGLRRTIQIYGTRQLLFGTHAPFFVVRSAILKLQEARLSEEERKAITSGNACEVFSG